jgi:hypothetical protein
MNRYPGFQNPLFHCSNIPILSDLPAMLSLVRREGTNQVQKDEHGTEEEIAIGGK